MSDIAPEIVTPTLAGVMGELERIAEPQVEEHFTPLDHRLPPPEDNNKHPAKWILTTRLPDVPSKEGSDTIMQRLPQDGTSIEEKMQDPEFLKAGEPHPLTIVVEVGSLEDIRRSENQISWLALDYWRLPPDERPTIILKTDGFKLPLFYRYQFQGMYFVSSQDEFEKVNDMAARIREMSKSKIFDPTSLEPGQKASYDASKDLREWEQITADTYQSLANILKRISDRQKEAEKWYSNFFEKDGLTLGEAPLRTINTVLDLGTGEGRIGGMLARLGKIVVGMDISPETLERGRERLKEEGEGLRGEKEHPGLSYEALQKLMKDHPEYFSNNMKLILDDEEAAKHYLTHEGSFFSLYANLNDYMNKWRRGQINNEIPIHEVFEDVSPEFLYHGPRFFEETGFDMVIINWHTFCEIGDPLRQKDVLHQIHDVLARGGELLIEIPDRYMEPYIGPIKSYHDEHPDEPFGTLRDKKPEGEEGYYPPRYFPDSDELMLLINAVGFDIDFEKDLTTYTVGEGKEGVPHIKELVVTARKSR